MSPRLALDGGDRVDRSATQLRTTVERGDGEEKGAPHHRSAGCLDERSRRGSGASRREDVVDE